MVTIGLQRIPPTRARIAVGGISHETNTFVPGRTTLDDVRRRVFLAGDSMVHAARESHSALGGVISGVEAAGATLVPLLFAWAPPGPLVAFPAFRALQRDLLERLERGRAHGGVDAVVLCLHGAMVAEGVDDAEGAVLAAARRAVGPAVPIIVVLDFHANITPAMVDAADLLLGYDTYPHIDTVERGREAAARALDMLAGGWRPAMAIRRLPLLTPLTAQRTDGDTPWRALIDLAHEAEARPGVVGVTLAAGFPYADMPSTGASVVVAVRENGRLATEIADEIAAAVWQRRHDMRDTSLSIAGALAVEPVGSGPTIVADGGDNPGAGAPGHDASLVLAYADSRAMGVVAGALHEPSVVARAVQAGVGARIALDLATGGRAVVTRTVDASVERLGDGVFTNEGPMGRGSVSRLGRTTLLDIGGVRTIFCERVAQTLDPALFRAHGIDPERCRIVVVKSSVHFRAGFGPLAGNIIETDCGGWSSPDLRSFPYRRLARPMFPLEPGATP